jgi:predicted ATPase
MRPSQHRLKKQAAGFTARLAKSAFMSGWRIEMLGGLRAVRGDRTLARFPGRKAASLLAYLALSPGRFHTREALAEMLWPEVPRASQFHNLRLTLSRLRSLLAPDDALLDADRLAVRLDSAAFTTDVAEFEQAIALGDARAALALYSGPLLPDIYDEWILLPQARLETLREQLDDGPDTSTAMMRRASHRLPETLPLPLTRFFGRDAELTALKTAMQEETRLITLTGPGGTGKTRLALEAARRRIPGRATAFVSLADLTDAVQTPDAIRSALRLPAPTPGFSLTDLVRRELAAFSPLLLILDNAEHLLKGDCLVDFVTGSLIAVPSLMVLVASRRALGIPGEVVFPVGPLPMEARVALFLDRARAARPEFKESPQTLATVRDICRLSEGIPLALELAAARTSVLSAQEILKNIAQRLTFLSSRHEGGGVPRRHRSLRAAIRSSFDLLSPDLQRQFSHLSAFRGGFTAAASAAVAGTRLDTLDELLRWSLLLSEEQRDGSLRFRMLETLRDFGQECLTDQEEKALSRRHARYFCEWAEANRSDDAPGPIPDQATRLARQDAEQDNVRAALTFCRNSRHPADREMGLRLVTAFWAFWYVRNAGQEMEEWATGLLDTPATADPVAPLIGARALLSLGLAVREQGKIARFAALVEQALAVLEDGPQDRHLALALHLRGLASADQYRFPDSGRAYASAESLWEQLGDRRNAATTRHNRALLALEQSDLPLAETLCKQVLTVFREWNEQTWIAVALLTQAGTRAGRGGFAAATEDCAESAAIYRSAGYARGEAQAERDQCRYLAAQRLWDAAADHGRHALFLFRKVGDHHGEATALLSLADVSLRRGGVPDDMDQAHEYLTEAAVLQACHQWPSVAPLLAQIKDELRCHRERS